MRKEEKIKWREEEEAKAHAIEKVLKLKEELDIVVEVKRIRDEIKARAAAQAEEERTRKAQE